MHEIVGTMSGTSLDGVDVAALVTDGRTITSFGAVAARPYVDTERAVLRAALGRWPGEAGVAEAAAVVEVAHAEALEGIGGTVAFHGQTLAHAPLRSHPEGRGTHQAGDGAALAARLGRPVVWDFRSRDVALGGEGAPLAPAFHFAALRWAGLAGGAVLNLGGVGNLTWVSEEARDMADPGALLAFDTGPANAPVDDLVTARVGARYDEGGALAAAGRVDEGVVARFLEAPFFDAPAPKSLDRNAFAELGAAVEAMGLEDAAATLAACAAAAVARGLAACPARPERLLLTGGGRHNAALVAMIAERAGVPAQPIEAAGLDGDMLEAQAFAFLGARVLEGLPITFPGTTGVAAPARGGRVSRA